MIIAAARGTEYDKAVGLDIGAEDYLVKHSAMIHRAKIEMESVPGGTTFTVRFSKNMK